MKLTEPFPPEIKPVHIGVYQKICADGSIGHQYWNGKYWCGFSIKIKDCAWETRESCFQDHPWRGLAEKP